MRPIRDLTGQRFGKLVVIKNEGIHETRRTAMWLCKCDCGNEKVVAAHDLKHGTTSCGCIAKISKLKNLKLGHELLDKKAMERKSIIKELNEGNYEAASKRLYTIWTQMKSRCNDTARKEYKNYGGRGIKVCEEWNEFTQFLRWAVSNGYKDNLTLDRKDNNGDYEPSNCRWISFKEQQNNRRNNHTVNINGVNHTISEWSDISGIKQNTIYYRIKRGWKGEEIIRK